MRYRRLTATRDYQFGHGGADFLVDSPSCVGQSVRTRLLLMEGEWFLDVTEGTPYGTEIFGAGTKPLYDLAIQQRVLETDGVTSLANYSSDLDHVLRKLSVAMTINTRFGQANVSVIF